MPDRVELVLSRDTTRLNQDDVLSVELKTSSSGNERECPLQAVYGSSLTARAGIKTSATVMLHSTVGLL